ncbi:MAG: DUF4363 family protein [Acholeplasmataceae bacterium]|nr:DUF4363 family protein [Acholeplasmataceae bacterium]
MESGHFLKRTGGDFPGLLEEVQANVQKEDYDEALLKAEAAEKVYLKISRRTQFSVELRELSAIKHSLAYLEGALVAHNGEEALVQIYLLKSYWQELGK